MRRGRVGARLTAKAHSVLVEKKKSHRLGTLSQAVYHMKTRWLANGRPIYTGVVDIGDEKLIKGVQFESDAHEVLLRLKMSEGLDSLSSAVVWLDESLKK